MSLHIIQIVLLESADRNALKLAIPQPPETCLFGATKSRGRFEQSLEHRLQVERRAADNLEHVGGSRLLLTRLFQFAGESGDLLLEVGGGYASSRRFVRLGPSYALPLYRLSAFTASLHVAPLRRVHDDAQS